MRCEYNDRVYIYIYMINICIHIFDSNNDINIINN